MNQGFLVFVHLQMIKTLFVFFLSVLSRPLFRNHLLLFARLLHSALGFVDQVNFASEIQILLSSYGVLFYLFPSERKIEILDIFFR